MKHIVLSILLMTLFLPALLFAAEVVNLKVGQSGDSGFASFDLAGDIGEREADVTVSLTIAGRKYEADKLTLKGDFGKKVKTGVGKRIIWDILADIPTGFDGEVVWNVDSVGGKAPAVVKEIPKPAAKPAFAASLPTLQSPKDSPFEFSELVVRDKNTGLLWLREVSKNGDGMGFQNARSKATRMAADKFAGCSGWTLPVAENLTAMVTYAIEAGYKGKKSKGYPADFFNVIGFKGVLNDYYWTALGDPKNPGIHTHRLAIDLEDGMTISKPIMDYLQAWPVCKPDSD